VITSVQAAGALGLAGGECESERGRGGLSRVLGTPLAELPELAVFFDRRIDPRFLAEAGWDPAGRLLSPAPEHVLLGRPICRAPGCLASAYGTVRICIRCRRRLDAAGLGVEDVGGLPEPSCRPPSRCTVPGCLRVWKTARQRLCLAHLHQKRQLKLTLQDFLAHPGTVALPSLGPCLVPACARDRIGASGSYCDAHQQRFRLASRKVAGLDEQQWRAGESVIAQYGQISFYGLAPLVTIQLLFALQQRTRDGARTNEKALRGVCERLRLQRAATIVGMHDPARSQQVLVGDRNARCLLVGLAGQVHRALLDPETEKTKDVWDLVAFGRTGGRLSFANISQDWLRDSAKRWAIEELPKRRGRGVGTSIQCHLHSLARLSQVLGLRPDGGKDAAVLGRADIEALLNRLAYQETTGTITHPSRVMACRQCKLVLARIRAMGLTRPGGPAAGLGDDFAVLTSDIPYQADRAEPCRDLPAEVMRQLCAQLPALQAMHGLTIRAVIELVIDTGRRPDEICALAWDCLTRDTDGAPVLIYDNIKAGRLGRRLPIAEATAELIIQHKQRTRERFPDTPLADLPLFPTPHRNPDGRKAIAEPGLSGRHRSWVDSLPPLLLADGTEFDKAKIVPYAYRHTYAQRHADAGVPPDVLRELLDHLNFDTTRQYYRIGEERRREAVDRVSAMQFDRHGNRVWRTAQALLDSERIRRSVGQVAVPFGVCAEPSNVQAGGNACPYRFRCAGCDHFRTDVSYLPDLQAYLDDLLRNRERVLAAADVEEWARAEAMPSDQEITAIRRLISRITGDLDQLTDADRAEIDRAVTAVRRHRTTMLGMPRVRPSVIEIRPEHTA
jgi:integrase